MNEELYLKVYLTNLGKYTEGDLIGEWVDVDGDTDWDSELANIGVSAEPTEDGEYYGEYFITDYDSNIPGIYEELGEYPSLDTLDEIGEAIQNVDAALFCALMELIGDFHEVIRVIEDGDYVFYSDVEDDEDLGRRYINEIYGSEEQIPVDVIERYFDYDAYGRDINLESDGMHTDYGWIERLY